MNVLTGALLHSKKTPRVWDRRSHAVLDYLTVAYFFCVAGYFWGRNGRATATAMTNAAAVLGTSMFTDYSGALRRVIPFETHGKIDMLQATTAATMPVLLGFADDAAAMPFHLQAVNEVAVISSTDWESRSEQEPLRMGSRQRAS